MSTSSITERLADLLARTAPFDHLTDEQRRSLLTGMALEIYQPGEVVLEQGTDVHRALYIVESGLVRLMDVDGRRLLDMCGEGAQFGSYGLMQGGILPYEARAVEPTVCALLSADAFRQLLKSDEAFRAHFEEDLQRYVRTLGTEMDASGAFLLFDTELAALIRHPAATVSPETALQEAARTMASAETDTLVVVPDGAPVGIVTEGDFVEKVVAAGRAPDVPVMALIERPPVTLNGSERLFDAVREMMRHNIRRVVVVDDEAAAGTHAVLGVVTSEDISHYRGLDPIATTEQVEKARTVEELADIRTESNRRMIRLFQQGVHSADLLGVIAEIDDQLKRRLLFLMERKLREEHPEAAYEGPWAWLSFGTPGRRESTIYARQDNGLIYADPPGDEAAERAARWYGLFAERASAALERCGFPPTQHGLIVREEAFRQPLAQWQAAYTAWTQGADPDATARAAVVFDVRTMYGDEGLCDALRETYTALLPNPRLRRILLRQGTRVPAPLSFFGRLDVEPDGRGGMGINLRHRGLQPIVAIARALALDAGYFKSSNTFDRLRFLANADHPASAEAKVLLGAFQNLVDMHLLVQMQAAEVGEPPTDWIDPETLHRSRQNLLRDTFKTLQRVQASLEHRYGNGR